MKIILCIFNKLRGNTRYQKLLVHPTKLILTNNLSNFKLNIIKMKKEKYKKVGKNMKKKVQEKVGQLRTKIERK